MRGRLAFPAVEPHLLESSPLCVESVSICHIAGGSTISPLPVGHCLQNYRLPGWMPPSPPQGWSLLCSIWRDCQSQEQLPSVPCWNTLSSTAQHNTGHPNWSNRKVLQGNATSVTLPAKLDRLESQEMFSSRMLGHLNLALFPWVLWFPHHIMRRVSWMMALWRPFKL